MRGKIKILILILALLLSGSVPQMQVDAAECPDLRIVFARGSGGARWEDDNYLEYKRTIESKLQTVNLNYEFIDLDYPAIGIGVDKVLVAIGAYVGAGESYEFGESVNAGVENLVTLVNNECPNTKYVIGGYSQGAMVVSKSLAKLNPDKIIYAATFGDPKIYLPEGKGIDPPACHSKDLSDYRIYVPDCRTYKGLLGGQVPYRPDSLAGRVGTWCNKGDIFCSSRMSVLDHTAYISENLYEDASRLIFDKVTKQFGLPNLVTSPHDTVILIDSTESMKPLIDSYKQEALRLAEQTFESGGRIALYDYRDLDDPYQPVEHCNFNTCNLETVRNALKEIEVGGGGDNPESLLSAAFNSMQSLEWKKGATKSLVVLTDSKFLSPDRDGVSIDEVIKLSKEIDPVNFYIITDPKMEKYYTKLASETDGKVVTNLNELDLLTDYIMARYDSLPRVEEYNPWNGLTLELDNVEILENGDIKISLSGTASVYSIIVNDKVFGMSLNKELVIGDLDLSRENTISLVPLSKYVKGDPVLISLSGGNTEEKEVEIKVDSPSDNTIINYTTNYTMQKKNDFVIPKAPNTGLATR